MSRARMTDEQALEAIDAWIAELEVGARTDEMSRAFKVARDILLYDRNAQHKKAVLSRALVAHKEGEHNALLRRPSSTC